jgi:zinc protease
MIGFRGMSVFDEDRYVLYVLNEIFSSPRGRLYKNIREKDAMAYAVGAYYTLGLDPGYYCIYVATTKNNILKSIASIKEQIRILQEKYVTDRELIMAKRRIITDHLAKIAVNSDLAERVALDELYGLGHENYKAFPEKINRVTKEDVRQLAQKLLDLNKAVIVKCVGNI